MEKISYENIFTNITLHQIDSTSLHLLFQRNFTFNKCDKLLRFSLSLPDIHLDLVFINDVLICQKKNPLPKSRLQGKCGRKCVICEKSFKGRIENKIRKSY